MWRMIEAALKAVVTTVNTKVATVGQTDQEISVHQYRI